jgi:fucose permease
MGTVLFCAAAFVPMFTQGVLGGTAVDAGMTLAPMSIGWPIASTTSGWLLAKRGYRPFILAGSILTTLGCLVLAATDPAWGRGPVMLAMFVTGLGLGFLSTPYLLAVQNAVPWHRRGVATSSVQFFRTIGGSIAVAALGATLNHHLAAGLTTGLDPNVALDPELRLQVPPEALQTLVSSLDVGLGSVYVAMAALALVGVGIGLLFPGGPARIHAFQDTDTEPEGT